MSFENRRFRRIRGPGQRHVVEAAPALVTAQHLDVADVAAQARRIEQRFRERGNVLQTQIQPLPGQRVNAVRGIADQRKAGPDIFARQVKLQRIRPARRHGVERAQMRAEPPGDFGVELGVGQRHIRAACFVGSTQTSETRLPCIGRMANGPSGRKCSDATP